MKYDLPNAGRIIRAARKSQKISAACLGAQMVPPVSGNAVTAWERGQNNLKIDDINQICEILKLDASSFFIQENPSYEYAVVIPEDPIKRDIAEFESCYARMSKSQRRAVLAVASAMVETHPLPCEQDTSTKVCDGDFVNID